MLGYKVARKAQFYIQLIFGKKTKYAADAKYYYWQIYMCRILKNKNSKAMG